MMEAASHPGFITRFQAGEYRSVSDLFESQYDSLLRFTRHATVLQQKAKAFRLLQEQVAAQYAAAPLLLAYYVGIVLPGQSVTAD